MSLSFPLRRAFLALPLDGSAKRAFQEVQQRLQPFATSFRFQNPENPHLTLYFWDELMEIEYGDVLKKIETIAARTDRFTFRVTEAKTFDDRVLVLEISRSQELASLKKRCPWPNPPTPLRAGSKSFSPHITLARMRNPNAFRVKRKRIMKVLGDASFDVTIDRIRFYAEIDDIRQTPIRDFPFRVVQLPAGK